MFLSGPGGSGKSKVIKHVLVYAEQFCSLLNYPFDKYTIMVTASTGVAATLINGDTIHRSVGLSTKDDRPKDQKSQQEDIRNFKRVRMLIIDEISMLGHGAIFGCFLLSSEIPFFNRSFFG